MQVNKELVNERNQSTEGTIVSRTISDLEMLREYFKSVLAGANHHANDVDRVIYPLMGFVLQHSEGPIESRMYLGHIVHQLWLRVRGQRYGMSLNTTLLPSQRWISLEAGD